MKNPNANIGNRAVGIRAILIFFEVTIPVALLHAAADSPAGRPNLQRALTTEHVDLSMHNSQITPTAHRSYASSRIPYANKSDR